MIRQEQRCCILSIIASFSLLLLIIGIILAIVGHYDGSVLMYVGLITISVSCIAFVLFIVLKIVSNDKNPGYNTGVSFTMADQDPEVGLLHKTDIHNVNETSNTVNRNEESTSDQAGPSTAKLEDVEPPPTYHEVMVGEFSGGAEAGQTDNKDAPGSSSKRRDKKRKKEGDRHHHRRHRRKDEEGSDGQHDKKKKRKKRRRSGVNGEETKAMLYEGTEENLELEENLAAGNSEIKEPNEIDNQNELNLENETVDQNEPKIQNEIDRENETVTQNENDEQIELKDQIVLDRENDVDSKNDTDDKNEIGKESKLINENEATTKSEVNDQGDG